MSVPVEQDIESPCNDECGFAGGSEYCSGCYRTMDEIMSWWNLSAEERLRIVERIRTQSAG